MPVPAAVADYSGATGVDDPLYLACTTEMYRFQYRIIGGCPSCYENFKQAPAKYSLGNSYFWMPGEARGGTARLKTAALEEGGQVETTTTCLQRVRRAAGVAAGAA